MRLLEAKAPNGAGGLAVLASLLLAAGCNPYPSVNHGELRIARVMAVDVALTKPPIVSEEDPGTHIVLDDVPLNYATIRIEFNKPLDGQTVQADPGGTDLCTPTENITISIAYPDGVVPQATGAQVCYEPNGYNPAIVMVPSTQSSGVPVLLDSLEPDFQYTISATGVRDHDGNSLDFTVTVNAASLSAAATAASSSTVDDGSVSP